MPHRTPSDFGRAYPSSREWLSLLIRRMDAVASVYRLAALLSPGIDGLRSHVESRDALESRGLRLSCNPSWVFDSSYHSLSCLAFHKSYSTPVIRHSLRASGQCEGLSDALLACRLTPCVVPVLSS